MHGVQCQHDLILMILSFAVSVLSSLTALQLAMAIPSAKTSNDRWFASALAGFAMGGGAIWSMHFLAMLACKMSIPVSYDAGLTALSIIVAVISCSIGLAVAGAGPLSAKRLISAAGLMGLGVAGMHYIGMAAMIMPADTTYNMTMVAASLVVAFVASGAALWLAFNMRGPLQMLGSAVAMGVAVSGMHYIGMAAASFEPTEAAVREATSLSFGGEQLGLLIFGLTVALLAILFTTNWARQRQRASLTI